MGSVYLLLEVDKNGGEYFKIGITKRNIDSRISELQTGNPNKISLLKSYDSKNYKQIEKWLHTTYTNQKSETDNEWFSLDDDQVINFINSCKKADEVMSVLKESNPFFELPTN